MTDEAALLDRHLRRLTRGHQGARGLSDDVALLGPGQAVVTKDLLVADVHFFASDALSDIGFKAIATNASDLIAKGVRPAAYFLGL
ncbi:MAG: AIR synthase related protein, partial [Pseudomonadota bacterium]